MTEQQRQRYIRINAQSKDSFERDIVSSSSPIEGNAAAETQRHTVPPALFLLHSRDSSIEDAYSYSLLESRLSALEDDTGRTKEEILAAAVTLYELALKAQEHNKKFGVVEQDQQMITEVGRL